MDCKRDFHHPFTPYAVQETFMNTVYEVLDRGGGGIGILESPTGTGKSLSLICSSLTWLRDFKRKRFEEGLEWSTDISDEPEWIIEQAKARKRRELLSEREDMEARLARVRAKEKAQREKYLGGEPGPKRRRVRDEQEKEERDEEEQFALDDYDSDQEGLGSFSKGAAAFGLSAETMALMKKLGMKIGSAEKEEQELEDEIKIFYCSRTHSQLTQFINELRRVKIPPAFPSEISKDEGPESSLQEFKHLALGSRRNLCINTAVSKLRTMTAINERCLELQQPRTATSQKCSFVPSRENQALVNDFRDHSLASIRDIEDLGLLGRKIGICPYYASRAAIKPSEIVTLPYPLLLQKSARDALGISLKGHVVIVDEAHNLMDAISGIYSAGVTLGQAKISRAQLGLYLQKFKNRLKGKNRVYVAQVFRLVDSLAECLERRITAKNCDSMVEPKEVLAGKGVDQINLYKLLRYLKESKLARKVEGYVIHTEQQTSVSAATSEKPTAVGLEPHASPTAPTLQHITAFLEALTNPSREGQFFYNAPPSDNANEASLKYMLLDPTHHFRTIVSEARAVILAGGTMSPISDYTTHLLSYCLPSQVTTLSCGHVMPQGNLLAWVLSTGPTGKKFEFTYGKRAGREGEEMVDELGKALLNICGIVPDGVVVFFPSYAYLDSVVHRWQLPGSGTTGSIWGRLGSKKTLFREGRDSKSGSGEDILGEYSRAIGEGKGGLLLSVVGGKMSEGINFSDRLGRCVVIVGLPFPNIQSAEWKAKLAYIESVTMKRLGDPGDVDASTQAKPWNGGVMGGLAETEKRALAKQAARDFYENACMRAVNQSVGRAIRHASDYAAIVLIDARFGSERIREKLSGWIREAVVVGKEERGFVELMGGLGRFFREKRE